MKKRVIILLSLLMCLFFAFSTSATVVDSGTCGDNLTWTFDDIGTLTISGTGDMYNWRFEDAEPEYDAPWYRYRETIDNVIVEAGVTSIGNQAFSCFRLVLYYESIGGPLTSISIPDTVVKIGERAFEHCSSLESIVIPNSVTSIGNRAFNCCTSLKEIFIPASVTSLGRQVIGGLVSQDEVIYDYAEGDFGGTVLGGCTSLESITVDSNNKMYSNDERGVLFNKDKTILIKYPIGNKATSYKIPDGVTIIGRGAFEGCSNLKEIIIPEGVTCISSYAFEGCSNLKEIIIPESVISVDYGAFEDCTNLESVDVGNSITIIDESAFDGCTSLKNITVAENNELYSKDERGVLFNKDKTILIKYPVKIEGTSYEIPDGVTKINDYAFKGCTSLEEVLIPDGVTSIGYSAFEDCTRLKAIVIPDSVTGIGERAFYGCTNLKSVKIGSRVTNIGGMYAFAFCTSLESIEIPESVTYVGQFSFMYCRNLKKATVLSRNAEFSFSIDDVFGRSNPVIYGYKGSTAETEAKEYNRPFVALSATPTNAKVLINGKEVAFTAYNIGGNNYFKLRDVAMALNGSEKNFNVGWDSTNNAISLTSNQSYTSVGGELIVDANATSTEPIVTNSRVYKDSEPVSFIAFNIGGNNYFKLRDIGKAFDFGIGWDNETKTITIDTSIGYTE
ncbi:MAG: hypothetical protein E7600_01800 [Ruminococcaceae bacterium]|nr:hypothetical protein [Oscillospiraceae bacterium]